eukprot:1455615-Amphidinium_carterae.1
MQSQRLTLRRPDMLSLATAVLQCCLFCAHAAAQRMQAKWMFLLAQHMRSKSFAQISRPP